MTTEKSHQVWHPAVINISIGSFQSPVLGILAEITFHVFMNLFLQIDVQFPISTDDDVGTYTPI